jgi:hypothetical protein
LLGNAFGTKDDQINRTELLIVIRPRVVRDSEDARRAHGRIPVAHQVGSAAQPDGTEQDRARSEPLPALSRQAANVARLFVMADPESSATAARRQAATPCAVYQPSKCASRKRTDALRLAGLPP